LVFWGVSLPVVQVGGGLIVVAVGWSMLTQNDQVDSAARKTIQSQEVFRRAFYPLTLPLTVGPGSISAAITLGANATHRYGVHVLMIVVAVLGTALIGVSIFLCYGFGSSCSGVRRYGYDGHRPVFVVPVGLHWCADRVERD